MSYNSNYVTTSNPKTGGALFHAPLGTKLPTDAKTDLDQSFIGLGYISEDGYSKSEEIESEEITAWGGDVVDTPQTGKKFSYTTTLIETLNPEVLKVVHGAKNVQGSLEKGLTVKGNSVRLPSESYVFEEVMKNDVIKRTVIPNGKITSIGEVTINSSQVVGYQITIKASPDETENSYYEYYISSDGALVENELEQEEVVE